MKKKLIQISIIIILITIISSCFNPAENTLEIDGVEILVSHKDSTDTFYPIVNCDSIRASNIKLLVRLSERHYTAQAINLSIVQSCYAFQYETENVFINQLENLDVWFGEEDDSINITSNLTFNYDTLTNITKDMLIEMINNKIDYHAENATSWPSFEFNASLSNNTIKDKTTGKFTIYVELDDGIVSNRSNNFKIIKE